jgi:hypothetical protein
MSTCIIHTVEIVPVKIIHRILNSGTVKASHHCNKQTIGGAVWLMFVARCRLATGYCTGLDEKAFKQTIVPYQKIPKLEVSSDVEVEK